MKILFNSLFINQVKKTITTIAEFAIQQLAMAMAQYLIELRRREAIKKITKENICSTIQ